MAYGEDITDYDYYSAIDAAEDLSSGLADIETFKKILDGRRDHYSGLTYHEEKGRLAAVSRVKASIYYLYNEAKEELAGVDSTTEVE